MSMRVFLLTLGPLIIICWLGTLSESYHGNTQIVVSDDTLFLGLSVLLAGWLVALSRPAQEPTDRLASDYIQLLTKIGDKTLTPKQLAEEVGETSDYVYEGSGPGFYEKKLSAEQKKSLEQLIYEGKICFQDGQYSLPPESPSK